MADTLLIKRYINHFGLDLKSSDLTRPSEYSSGMLNAQYKKSGSIEKRPGYHANGASQGGHGLFTYAKVNPTTGVEEPELLTASNSIYRADKSILTVTYVGADPTAFISIYYDSTDEEYKCEIQEGTTVVLDQGLGIGFDEGAIYTIDDLRSDIDALANFTATLSGATSTPAAFIPPVRAHDLSSSGEAIALEARYWTQVNTTSTNPLAGSETNKNSDDFENVSSVQIKNVMYFSNGYDDVLKYDGQTLYKAGLPTPTSLTTALGAAGTINGNNYQHRAQYIQYDAVGNVIEGNIKTMTGSLINATSDKIDVTVANIVAGTGYNTNCAIVNGVQAGVTTITVDNGSGGVHTLQTGDTAYFYDGVSASYVEREVTATSSTTITISGAAVNVADNAVISNNLRIAIYRNESSATTPTTWQLVAEIPNNSFSSTQVYSDDTADASLGADLVEPLTDRSPPPKGKYVSSFRDQMIIAGSLEARNTVYWSDVESPEYFPADGNSQDAATIAGDVITGIAPNNEVFAIFKKKSIHILSGDISENNIRFDQLTSDIGCVAHATIREVRGRLYFLSDLGPRMMTGGQLPEPVGPVADNPNASRIDPVFDSTTALTDNLELRLKRAVAVNNRLTEKYIIYIPTEDTVSGDVYATENSNIFAYDYSRDAWLEWDNMNMAGGIVEFENDLFWNERRYSTFTGTVNHILWRRMNLNDAYDYEDNTSYIDWNYKGQWEFAGEASILKRYPRIRVFTLEENPNNQFNLTVQTEINFVAGETKAEFDLSFEGIGYGISEYGNAPYGDSVEPAIQHRLNNGRMRSLRPVFVNQNHQENVILTGWELEMLVPFRAGFKS